MKEVQKKQIFINKSYNNLEILLKNNRKGILAKKNHCCEDRIHIGMNYKIEMYLK